MSHSKIGVFPARPKKVVKFDKKGNETVYHINPKTGKKDLICHITFVHPPEPTEEQKYFSSLSASSRPRIG